MATAKAIAFTAWLIVLALVLVPGDVPRAALPNDYRFVANHEAATQPLLGPILRKGRHLIVNRGSATSRAAAARRMILTLSGGASLLLFPEGTRANSERMGAFSSGAFRAAILAGRPVVPVAVIGTGRMLPRGSWLCQPPGGRARWSLSTRPQRRQLLPAAW